MMDCRSTSAWCSFRPINTPQFDWALSRMPRRAQPVPPIYQPEAAARAIVFAAFSRRREIWLGGSSWKAIVANAVAPRLLDHLLARDGYASQMRDEAEPADAPANLFEPVRGSQGAHGSFDDRARGGSWTLPITSTGQRLLPQAWRCWVL